MSTKSQQRLHYQRLKVFLRKMREDPDLTQDQLEAKRRVPQSYVYKSETAIRVDITEFVAWSKACGKNPVNALRKFLKR